MKKVIEYIIQNWDSISVAGLSLYEIIVRFVPTAKSYTIVRVIIWLLTNVDKLQITKK